MTNKEIFAVIGKYFEGSDAPEKDEVLAFVEKQTAAIAAKNAKAKERAAAKRAEGDALRGQIEALLSDSPMTVNDIVSALDNDEITPAKVISRVTQLVKAEKAVKGNVTVEGRKLVTYVKA